MANKITYFRILCSILMLFFKITSTFFLMLYMLCGLSDVLDGIIARKTNTVSKFGARIDTVADFIFVVVVLIKMLSVIDVQIWLWIWIIAIAGIKITNIIFGFLRTKRFIVEHTILNKVTGVLFFVLPFTLYLHELKYGAIAVCTVATFSAIQEGCYIKKDREIV